MKIIEVTNNTAPAANLYKQIEAAEKEIVTVELTKAELMALFCLTGNCCGSTSNSIQRWTGKFYAALDAYDLFSKEFVRLSRETNITPDTVKLLEIV